ncbi:MAG TPA: glucosaminidase domain-containing protein [Bacteroidales bacterium]|nr:glucosaminidase domain-containing protein [Bacteroidales bacterium]
MLKKAPLVILFIFTFFLASCRSTRPVSNATGEPGPRITVVSTGNAEADYINTYKDIAISEMRRTGVPASITLAQGMIESNYGRSELARRGNNHFGIKCHNWDGAAIYHNDDRRNDCFRKYSNPEESFMDHSDFLKNGSRYSFLFGLPYGDYKGWARGLKKAGYATNPDYANMLIRKIEEENLTVYDKGFKAERSVEKQPVKVKVPALNDNVTSSLSDAGIVAKTPRIIENNRIECVIVKDGDTREKLEDEFKLLRWELPRYNELNNDFEVKPGEILYLQPKRDKAEAGKENYTTREGDTMYQISQKFGIKLKSLYEMNRMDQGSEPKPGTKLWLRAMKPVS